eukprot:SAG31_NODE_25773_length_454_cov_1.459155_2_plen_70_part_01
MKQRFTIAAGSLSDASGLSKYLMKFLRSSTRPAVIERHGRRRQIEADRGGAAVGDRGDARFCGRTVCPGL